MDTFLILYNRGICLITNQIVLLKGLLGNCYMVAEAGIEPAVSGL
jgi:hypothetical protein